MLAVMPVKSGLRSYGGLQTKDPHGLEYPIDKSHQRIENSQYSENFLEELFLFHTLYLSKHYLQY